MTTAKEINYVLSNISVEAYMAGLSEGQPIHFTPGNKTQGNAPRIEFSDGTVPEFMPELSHKDSNALVMKKLEVVVRMFYVFRMQRQAAEKKS